MLPEPKKKAVHLAEWKRQESERTYAQLNEALGRFKSGRLTRLPKGAKLTRLNFAKEAGVSKDTPFSRYRKGHPKAGEYRFPQVVDQFNRLRKKMRAKPKEEARDDDIAKLKAIISELESMLYASRCVTNAQDIENVKVKLRNKELEDRYSALEEERDKIKAELIELRRQNIREATD